MNKSVKLQPIAKISQQQERNAARSHGDSIRQVEQQQQQLNELINYRNQYLNAFRSAGESGLPASQMQDYRLFLSRLDDAIAQQQQQVMNGQQQCEIKQEKWMHKRSRSKMVNKVVEKRQLTEHREMEKREQRELEDQPHKTFTAG